MTLRELSNQSFESPWVKLSFEKNTMKANSPIKSKSIETWLSRGGMPVFCGISDNDERIGIIQSWLDAICFRDLMQFKDAEYNGNLASNLITSIASNAKSPLVQLASEFGATPASVKKHLAALEALFLIYKIPSFENPRAQTFYTLFDAGVLNAILGGQQTLFSLHACILSLVINEIYAQYEYSGKLKPSLYYYKSRGGAEVDLVLKTQNQLIGIECTTSVDISPYKQRGMKSFLKQHPQAKGYFIAPVQSPYQLAPNIYAIPWNNIA